jgi:hypothetical protein
MSPVICHNLLQLDFGCKDIIFYPKYWAKISYFIPKYHPKTKIYPKNYPISSKIPPEISSLTCIHAEPVEAPAPLIS